MTRGQRAAAWAVAGAGVGVGGMILALPYVRQVDPLGLSPVVLISLTGGFVFGWYLRGKADRAPGGCGSAVSSKSP